MVKHKITPFPDANVGEVLGLVEIIYSYGGKVKISFIAEELRMELDDLGDAIEAAELLGFLKVRNGEVQLTVYGEALDLGTISDKKAIIKKRIVVVEPFKTILQQLKKKQTLKYSEIIEVLNSNEFLVEDKQRFHKILLSWGNYSEIFEYDGENTSFKARK